MSSAPSFLQLYRAALKSCGYEPIRLQSRARPVRASPSQWLRSIAVHPHHSALRHFSSSLRAPAKDSSNKSTDKSRVLAKPERFNPPSHPARLKKSSKLRYYGGELSQEAKAAQEKNDYPHMMPPEGSRMHWVLTSRILHTSITLGVLCALALTVASMEFRRRTPYIDLLPSWSQFFRHPLKGSRQLYDVVLMDMNHNTELAMAKREKTLEDLRKRKAYRVAHGLENPAYGLQGHAQGLEGIEFGEKDVRDSEVAEQVEFERKLKQAYLESIEKSGGDPQMAQRWIEKQSAKRDAKKWFGFGGE